MKTGFSFFLIAFPILAWTISFGQGYKWKTFKESSAGYSIKYPSGWKVQGGKGGFMCGKESGFLNAEWTMWLSETSDTERIEMFFKDVELLEDEKEIRNPITIDGVNGYHSVVTSIKRPDLYYEVIILKTASVWYKIQNNDVKDENFKLFYESFKILK